MKLHEQLDIVKHYRLNQDTVKDLETIVQYHNNQGHNWNESYAIREAIKLLYKKILKEMK